MTYLATNVILADGATTFWDFSFAGVSPDSGSGTLPYLYAADVKALELYKDAEGNAASAERVVYIDPALPLRANIVGLPVAAGRQVKIYRSTEIRFPLVDYRDRQAVTEFDLDLANRQAVFIAQETQDAASNNMALDKNENYDVKDRRIVNLAPGVDPNDAVNVRQLRTTLRLPASEGDVQELPNAAGRALRLLSFDAAGKPVATLPAEGSATELETRLSLPGGAGMVGYLGFTVASALAENAASIDAAEADITALYDSVADINAELSRTSRTVESFGPIGEGNDTPTLHLALAWLTAVPGRTLHFYPGRVYIQGPGTVPVVFEGSTYYPARFDINDASMWDIVGNGATIRASTALTDTQFNRGFYASRCRDFRIRSLTYDGRLDARTEFGGDAFNMGNELTGNRKSGITFIDCHDWCCTNVVTMRCMMDGFTVAGPDETAEDYANICTNFMFLQCKGLFNYRQGCSVIGGRDGLFLLGSYSDTGTIKGTLPMAGIDIESNFIGRPNVNIGMIGVEFARNFTGLAMTLAAHSCWAFQPQFRENRAYGVLMSQAKDCTVTGGSLFHTLPSAESETYAVYIMACNGCSVSDFKATVANPHRGAIIGSGSIDCTVEDSKFLDLSQSSGAGFAQFLCRVNVDTERCTVRGNQFTDSSGLGMAVTISSPSAICDDNRVASKWGAAGGGGIYIEACDSCKGNIVAGTNPGASADGAGIGLAPAATSVRQIGPNIDYLKRRLGAQVRRRGFVADVLNYSGTIDLPSIATNGSHNFDVTVAGAQIGDTVEVTLADPQYLYVIGRVLTPDTVRVTAVNTFTVVDPAPQAIRITVTANDV